MIAWILAGLQAVVAAAGIWLAATNGASDVANTAVRSCALIVFALVGAAVVARRPGSRIGWLFCLAPSGAVLADSAFEYATRGLVIAPGSLPLAAEAAWLSLWSWTISLNLVLVFVPLLFPDGRLPAPGWRWVGWLGAAGIGVSVVAAVWAWPLRGPALVGDDLGYPQGVLGILARLSFPLLLLAMAGAVASLVVRFRRSRGDERQQLKWFLLAVAIAVLGQVAEGLVTVPGGLLEAPMLGLPIAMGVAILRYRLYDIDRLINRTLVYGLVTALLAITYLAAVTVLQRALDPLTGESQLAVAASTLAVAALFRPLRRRVQHTVDRRFDRRRYDAARTVEQFRSSTRDAVDLDALTAGLLTSVRDTVQPRVTSLWLRRAP